MEHWLSYKASGVSGRLVVWVFLSCLLFAEKEAVAQAPPVSPTSGKAPYSLSVSVNEVEITFHAADAHNWAVLDLEPDEVDVLDNDTGPGQIVSMQRLQDRPVHAGFVIDTSGSVSAEIARNRAEAQEAVQRLLVEAAQGTAVRFGRARRVVQPWTNQRNDIVRSIGQIGRMGYDPLDGTSVYDTLFSTCVSGFGDSATTPAAKVILLFSDGEDTASHTTMQAAIDRCRQNNTAIYAFSPKPILGTSSSGPPTLRRLTEETGGRLFYANEPQGNIQADLDTVRLDLKNEYLILYRPKQLKHDGAFHRIVLSGPERVAKIVGTSGYYAPAH